MSPLMLTLVAAVEAYDRAREYVDRVSCWELRDMIVLSELGRSRRDRSLTKLEKDMAAVVVQVV